MGSCLAGLGGHPAKLLGTERPTSGNSAATLAMASFEFCNAFAIALLIGLAIHEEKVNNGFLAERVP